MKLEECYDQFKNVERERKKVRHVQFKNVERERKKVNELMKLMKH